MRLLPPIAVLLALFASSCATTRAPLKDPKEAMREADAPELSDDLGLSSLIESVEATAAFLEKAPAGPELRFRPRSVTRPRYIQALKRFVELGRAARSIEEFSEAIRKEYVFYEVYGDQEWGDVFITSYYELRVPGSLRKKGRFTQAIYTVPADLVSLDLAAFDPKYSQDRKLRGRVAPGNRFVPYFSREEIDSKAALAGRKLELCWLDPVDAFFLQVQGSGSILLPDGKEIRLAYAERNGAKYESIGKFLRAELAPQEVNLQTIEAYLRRQDSAEMQRILNLNPSYVFFRLSEISATTTLGISAADGRTIATDPKLFPKGALAFLTTTKPRFRDATELVPTEWEPLARFVLDHDTGGAITGPGRVDLFWGRGEEAKRNAGAMKQRGRLYYLLPREP
jgi:membrane-bound lytic murein transglycosylase A